LRLDVLLSELMERAGEVLQTQGRLRALLDAVVSIAEDLSLQAVLQRIVDAAKELVGARYAAVGVVGPDRRTLTDFVTAGLTAEEHHAIGELPRGRGLLGVVIDVPEPLRLARLQDHPMSFGFPPAHPPMTKFLGVPLRIRDTVFGNLYLTDKADGKDFTEEDEQLVVALAAAAGVAIQNAQLFEDQRRRQAWMTASSEVRSRTLAGAGQRDLLSVSVEQCLAVSRAETVAVALAAPDGALVVSVAAGTDRDRLIDRAISGDASPAGRAVAERSALVVDDIAASGKNWLPDVLDDRYARAVFAPLGGDEALMPLGLLLVLFPRDRAAHNEDTELIAAYANQLAVALQLSAAQHDRERLAVFEDRDRIARDLHDLVIQRLFAAGMTLQSTAPLIGDSKAREKLAAVVDDLDATIRDLRHAIYQLQANTLDRDLRADLQRVVDETASTSSAHIRLHLVGLVATAAPEVVRANLLAVVREALSNAVRHGGAGTIDVTVEVDRGLTLVVDDDGVGMDPNVTRRSGLTNMQARAAELGGSLRVEVGQRGVGTRLIWQVPLAADA
jgi:signal transduction histidine kinase